MSDENIVISKKEYEILIDSQMKLQALENGGVDNWEWYSDSLEEYNNAKERKEIEKKWHNIIDETIDDCLSAIAQSMYEPSERGAGWAFGDEEILSAKKQIVNKIINYL